MKKGLSLFLALLMVVLVFSPAFPSLGGIRASAANGDPVELAFNNLFVFEKWATNKNSTTEQVLHSDGTVTIDGATLTTDIANGSFTLTKTNASAVEVYTAFSMSADDPDYNMTYYMAELKPNTTYTFSYNLSGSFGAFTPYIFMYDNSGAYVTNVYAQTTTAGDNSFRFTTGDNVRYAQVRFTINGTDATVNNINLYRTEIITYSNIFDFDSWASSEKSSKTDSIYGYNDGTISVDSETDSIYFATNTDANASGMLFTGFSLDTNDGGNAGFYTIDVEPNTTYTLYYNLVNCNFLNFQPWIVYNNEAGGFLQYTNYKTPAYGENSYTFTTTAETEYVSVVFGIQHSNQAWTGTVKDISLCETKIINHNFDPHRMCFKEGTGTYGTLPVPTAPEGKVFAGWYTGEDGSGKLITSDTEISYESYTVYPKFETEIDAGSLKVITQPTKTTYTVGEKFNPAGLTLQATVTTIDETTNEELKNTYNITSGFIYSPQTVGTTAGSQNITISYGGQTVSVPITVVDSIEKTVTLNSTQTTVDVTNNEYYLNLTADFNRYELTYYSNAYVKGTLNTVATDGTTVSEEFFLEPSDNGSFVSYIDGFLESIKYTNIATIKFEVLDKEFGTFELYTVDTILVGVPTDNMQYQQDDTHKVGIDLSKGGSLTYLEELSGDVVAVAYGEGVAAEVDYESMITDTSGTVIREGINLINRHDPGRYVQQSYYGTREDPYVTGDYNGVTWNYNPVQGGNYQFESSKIIEYRITTNQIYVKTRPLDWGKYSDEFANSKDGDYTDNNGNGQWDDGELMLDPKYGDDYITDSYMEAWYVFEDDTVKTYCRFVDYSGYPSATTTQELPAFYCVEPLNTFAYYNGTTVWEEEANYDYANKAVKINEPDFWGVSADYNNMLIANGGTAVNPSVNSQENWAAFMASDNVNSFGIGIYSAGVTNFHYGTYPQIYEDPKAGSTAMTSQFDNADMYESGVLTMPSEQDATSYIAPVDTMHFESYKPVTYSYYIATGNLHDIREDFRRAVEKDEAATAAQTVIAVPETAYMAPAEGASKVGKYYVNNIINETTNSIETVAERDGDMSFSVHIDGATSFTVDITNVTNPSDDIDLYTKDGVEVANDKKLDLNVNTGTQTYEDTHYLAFNTTGISFGEKATAKWTITGYDSEGKVVGTYIAYTVLYANERTVGAVAESRKEDISQNEISSWITGANGVDHSQRAPLGSFHGDKSASGYFKEDPLVYDTPLTNITSTGETPDDLINVATEYSDNAYVLQTATNGHDHSRAQSYLGLLRVDKSRYTNTNQIPNLKIGYDVLRVGSNANRSLANYYTLYTLGTSDSFTSTDVRERPSGWTTFATTTNSDSTIPVRETVIPSYAVSDIDGKYIHALNQARCWYISNMGESTGNSMDLNSYATAGTSLLCSLTDKGTLRDTVTQGYGLAEEKYSEDSYAKFEEALEKAGTVLGDPSVSQEEIDEAQKDLSDAMDTLVNIYYSLKYDNLFSAYEFSQHTSSMTVVSSRGTVAYNNGTITVTNNTLAESVTEAYTNYGSADGYYLVDLKPNTEYVFEYDVTTTVKSQAFMFFYNASGGAGDVPTNISVQTNGGAWNTKTESNPWWGNTDKASGKYVIRFTTGPNTVQASFRFGNSSNAATESTFSKIRLIESAKYYADATYSKTEDVYKEHASYGTMVTPTRVGYTFTGWQDASGNAVTGADIATDHLSVYSKWNENTYTIKFNANGGTGSIADKTVKYTDSVALPSTGVTNTENKLVLKGWATTSDATEPTYQLGQTVSKLTSTNNDTITLYAVWGTVGPINVTFDNLVDISAWSDTVSNGTPVNETDTGFTVKANEDTGEATCSSAFFTVEAGHKYIIEADIKGEGWDIYIFFHNETSTGTGLGFADGTSRMASGVNVSEVNGIKYTSTEFTAPAGATKAQLRVDANGAGNAVRFENIRVYDVTNTTYLETVNKYVEYGEAYGKLPVPVKEGQTFLGWVDQNGNKVTESSIMNSASTVYLKSTWTTNPNTVNDDTVVIEYGLPVVINVLSNDKAGSVVGGVGTTGLSDDDLGSRSHTSSILTDKTSSLTLANGNVKLNADGTITYTPSKTNVETETVFYYEATVDGAYYYAKVTVIPATTIYFEDTFFKFVDSTVTKNGTTYNYNWQNLGTSVGEVFQNTDRPGAFNFADDANNVYGYDSTYDSKVSYSGGSAHFVEVDQIAGTAAPQAVFTFTGTGFDLFSVTDNKSGTVTVTIYRGTEVGKNRVQGIMSNAYFGYSYDSDTDSYIASDNGALFQVPLIRARDLGYGTYTVVVQPRYNKSFDVAGTGKCGVYVDSVRIYDPMGNGNAVANEAYKADGEYAPQFLEIRDTLVTANKDGTFNITDLGNGTSVFLDGGRTSLDDFAKLGPKNEVYLGQNDAVTFHIVTDRAELPSTIQLGMRLTGKGGSSADVKLMNTNYNSWVENITLDSTAERYYNIEAVVDWVEQDDGTYKTAAPVIVTNTSEAIVSLTSLKWAFSDGEETATVLNLVTDEMTPRLAMAALNRALNPEVTPQQTILNKDNISFEFSGEPYAQGDSGVLTITTEQGVSGVTVNGTDVFNCEVNEDGKLDWTFEFTVDSDDSMSFEIIARDENGFTSESVYATINVEGDKEDGDDDSTTPDDGESDDTNGDSGNNVVIGPESFVTTLLNGIFNIIKKFLGLILGGATV